MPTTVIKEIGSGRNYSTIQAWEDAAPVNLTLSITSTCGTGSSTSAIQLNASASGTSGAYIGNTLTISGETLLITAYDNTTKIATVGSLNSGASTFTSAPTNGTNYTIGDVIWEGRVYDEGGGTNGEWVLTNTILIGGSTSDSTRFKRLKAAAGKSFSDNASTVGRYDTSKGVAIRSNGGYTEGRTILCSETYVELVDLQLKSRGVNAVVTASANNIKIYQCILEIETRTSSAFNPALNTGIDIKNCMILGGSISSQTANQSTYTNCTIFTDQTSMTAFASSYGGTSTFINCNVFGYATAGSGMTTVSSNNSTNLASITGSNNLVSQTASNIFNNVTVGSSLDLKLKSGSSSINAGTNTGAPIVDAFRTVRPQGGTVDIGFHEFQSTTSSIWPLPRNSFNMFTHLAM